MSKITPVLHLSDDYRVRVLDHLQWVLERQMRARAGLERAGERWVPFAYCRTRAGLETALSRLRCDSSVFLDPAPLASFPDFFPEVWE